MLLAALLLAAPPAAADDASADAGFSAWLATYRAGAIARGVPSAWLDTALAGASFQPRVIELDRAQPDESGQRTRFADYLARRLTDERVTDGRTRAVAHAELLRRIAADSGVPGGILVAIWGMETNYGRITGGFDLPSAVATLAYDGRRAALFTRELDALVRIVGEGRARRDELRGSWAGAFGQPQFLPSSFLAHGTDGDGDGRADIRNSEADTFASIAAYLKAAGWVAGVPWGFRTIVPAGFDRATVANPVAPTTCVRPLAAHSRWAPVGEWRAKGFKAVNAAWPADDVPMSLVEPDGPGTGAFLTTASYRAILDYNCSNFYALSVALLSDAVQYLLRP